MTLKNCCAVHIRMNRNKKLWQSLPWFVTLFSVLTNCFTLPDPKVPFSSAKMTKNGCLLVKIFPGVNGNGRTEALTSVSSSGEGGGRGNQSLTRPTRTDLICCSDFGSVGGWPSTGEHVTQFNSSLMSLISQNKDINFWYNRNKGTMK